MATERKKLWAVETLTEEGWQNLVSEGDGPVLFQGCDEALQEMHLNRMSMLSAGMEPPEMRVQFTGWQPLQSGADPLENFPMGNLHAFYTCKCGESQGRRLMEAVGSPDPLCPCCEVPMELDSFWQGERKWD